MTAISKQLKFTALAVTSTLALTVGAPRAAASPLPVPSVGYGITIYQTACPPAGPCVAVGQVSVDATGGSNDTPEGSLAPLIETQSGSGWVATIPPTGPEGYGRLFAVSCPAAGQCVAIGDAGDGYGSMIETESGGQWKYSLATSSSLWADDLYQLACWSPTQCVTIGSFAFAMTLSDGHWTLTMLPLPSNAHANQNYLTMNWDSEDCLPDGDCFAWGTYTTKTGAIRRMLDIEVGGKWSVREVPNLTNAAAAYAETCQSADHCFTIDVLNQGNHVLPFGNTLFESQSATRWQKLKVPLPANASRSHAAVLYAIACQSQSLCLSVGAYRTSAGHNRPLLVAYANNKLRTLPTPLPANASTKLRAELDAVICPAEGGCLATGFYHTKTGATEGFALREHGARWTATALVIRRRGGEPGGIYVDQSQPGCAPDGYCAVAINYCSIANGCRRDVDSPYENVADAFTLP